MRIYFIHIYRKYKNSNHWNLQLTTSDRTADEKTGLKKSKESKPFNKITRAKLAGLLKRNSAFIYFFSAQKSVKCEPLAHGNAFIMRPPAFFRTPHGKCGKLRSVMNRCTYSNCREPCDVLWCCCGCLFFKLEIWTVQTEDFFLIRKSYLEEKHIGFECFICWNYTYTIDFHVKIWNWIRHFGSSVDFRYAPQHKHKQYKLGRTISEVYIPTQMRARKILCTGK